jgi:radical SAM superfamily enzyme YgiQ (UPF0313 family)
MRVYPVSLGPNQFGHTEIFSAFYPLGCLAAFAKAYHDGELRDSFDFAPITPRQVREIPEMISAMDDAPGIVLLSSYVWNHTFNMDFARQVKERWPSALVIVGGPHIPRQSDRCEGFFAQHPYVDVAVRHEGEVTLAEVLETIVRSGRDAEGLSSVDLSRVAGLSFREGDRVVRTPDRGMSRDLTTFPSPYTTGEYDHWIADRWYVPLETNRGCPYGCTFCDWGAATLSKISQMSMDRVLGEIDFAARNHIHTIGYCDANFGILPRDLDLVRHIVEMKDKCGYPKEVGYTNAKTAKPRLGEIIKLLRDNGLTAAAQISMQTTDEQVLRNVERANIKTSEYKKMIAFFHREGIPAVSDMMVGLPGQTYETCKADLQFFFDHKVLAVVFATSVMPNAPMGEDEYRNKFSIEVGEDGMVESTYSFSRADYARMFELCLAYKLFIKLGLLRYFLYFAQIEHGVRAMDFVSRWLERVREEPARYPLSAKIREGILRGDYRGVRKDWLVLFWTDEQGRLLFDSLSDFHREIIDFYKHEHNAEIGGSDAEAVLTASRAVMPQKGRALPATVPLEHDVAGYFAELRKLPSTDSTSNGHVPLKKRPPGSIELSAQPDRSSYQYADIDLTYGALELKSNLWI